MSAAPDTASAPHSNASIPGLVGPPAAPTTLDTVTPEPIPDRVVVPAAAQSGVIICLDRVISMTCWSSVLGDFSTVADGLGLGHFLSRASVVAPYCEPNGNPEPSLSVHRHHLLNACRLAQTEHRRWPRFILAVVPDHDTWQVVQHLGLMEYGLAVQCIYGHLLLNLSPSVRTRIPALARALSRLNVKLGGCNVPPVQPFGGMYHTLVLGVAMAPVRGCRTFAWHCALVAAVDDSKHRWYTTTCVQTAQTHRVINIGSMLTYLLDMIGQPISRVVVVRDEIPPDDLEFVVQYETDQIKAVMSDRCGLQPRVAIAVPWDSLHDASSAEDYITVGVGSHPFAVPYNDFGGGWDEVAIGRYLASLAFDFAIDNRPTEWPVALKYASAAASTANVHYIEGRPKSLYKPLHGYKTLPRVIAQSPYWI